MGKLRGSALRSCKSIANISILMWDVKVENE
jgi:hypothetical protein